MSVNWVVSLPANRGLRCLHCKAEWHFGAVRPTTLGVLVKAMLNEHRGCSAPENPEQLQFLLTGPPKRLVEHKGLRFYRTRINDHTGRLEGALVDYWETENLRNPSVNQGGGLLANLLYVPESELRRGGSQSRMQLPFPVTPEIATAVATVIQWLGTNCGGGFLNEAFRRAGINLIERPL